MKSFLRWAGNKNRLNKAIIEEFPVRFNDYYEPFLGSGAIFFSLYSNKRIWRNSFLSDINQNLINCFEAVRTEKERVIKVLETCCLKNSEEFYYKMRENIENPSIFLYINRACFSGLYRVNSEGKFNVPWRHQDFEIMKKKISLDFSSIVKCSNYMKRFCGDDSISCQPWEKALTGVNEGDVVYLDPPYIPYYTGGFTAYEKGGFTLANHIYLNAIAKQLANKGAKAYLSNSYTNDTISIYGEPKKVISVTDSINSTAVSKGKRLEGLWVYG